MIRREASRLISTMAKSHPLLTIAGPRHAGKSALTKQLLPGHTYIDLKSPDVMAFAGSRPAAFFEHYRGNLVIDEFQRAPGLFTHIKTAAANRQIVLISSRRPSRALPAQEIAPNKTAGTITLLPLSIKELCARDINLERDEYIHRGFLPCAYMENADPRETQFNYLAALLQQDIAPLVRVENREAFKRFLRLLAERVGLALNPRTFAKKVGVPPQVLVRWMLVLEAHFVVFRLPVYPNSFLDGAQAIRSPKFYFTDVGLAAYLLRIRSPEQVHCHPAVGNLFENLVVAEALKETCNRHAEKIFYYRNREGLEIDLIMQSRDDIVPVEIKSAPTFNAAFARNLTHFHSFAENIKNGYIVYSGKGDKRVNGVRFINFREFGQIVRRRCV